ncbi:MAG TPA: hypothetical protein VJB57_02970 [Dehalococcoidia bacterium]|nr:hypothetical protein [Dehalococcoidia bacterium]
MIENRNLEVGARLVANYKKQTYVCTVTAPEDGDGLLYTLADGRSFKSPSAAGSAVMGGGAVNGWRFWSLEAAEGGSAPPPEATKVSANAKPKKGKKTIYRTPPGPNLGEGKSRWFCVACMKGFVIEGTDPPAACPEGHPMEDLHTEEVAS